MDAARIESLKSQSAYYESIRETLEETQFGAWVLICNGEVLSVFDDETAAQSKFLELYPDRHIMLRQVGSPEPLARVQFASV